MHSLAPKQKSPSPVRSFRPNDTDRLARLAAPGAAESIRRGNEIADLQPHPVFTHGLLQPKLTVGASNDPLEHEADRTAEQVMTMQAPGKQGQSCASMAPSAPSVRARSATASASIVAPPIVEEVLSSPGEPLDPITRAFMEPRFGHDFSNVRVHAQARAFEAVKSIGARAYTAGPSIVFGQGEYAPATHDGRTLLAHELAHVVQQSRRAPPAAGAPVQRKVKIGNKEVTENQHKTVPETLFGRLGEKLTDAVERTFTDTNELERFLDGKTDHIGDVVTGAETFWYRLPPHELTVLGENHHDEKGNVENVIKGLNTSRFIYEPFSEVVEVGGVKMGNTDSTVETINSSLPAAPQIGAYDPALENAVVKAMAGMALVSEFIDKKCPRQDHEGNVWIGLLPKLDFTRGNRAAVYLTLGINIAKDLAAHNFGPVKKNASTAERGARLLAQTYTSLQTILDNLADKWEKKNSIGIYELTEPDYFTALPLLALFVGVFNNYGVEYAGQLAKNTRNEKLEKESKKLGAKPHPLEKDFYPLREEMMLQKILNLYGTDYLLVGMGDAHRKNLACKLDEHRIYHAFVPDDLKAQKGLPAERVNSTRQIKTDPDCPLPRRGRPK